MTTIATMSTLATTTGSISIIVTMTITITIIIAITATPRLIPHIHMHPLFFETGLKCHGCDVCSDQMKASCSHI